MHCRLLTQYAIVMVQFLARLRKIKLHAGMHVFIEWALNQHKGLRLDEQFLLHLA